MSKPYNVTSIKETRSSTTEQGGERHFTTVTERQDWHNVSSNGIYAGRSYKITRFYVGPTAGQLHTLLNTRSEPWTD